MENFGFLSEASYHIFEARMSAPYNIGYEVGQ